MARRFALVGFADSWKAAPWDDTSIEAWTINEFWKYAPRWDRHFEVHTGEAIGATTRGKDPDQEFKEHREWLQKQAPGKPIYMVQHFEDIPASVRYPLEEMCERFGRRYFTSTIGYMLALAISEILDSRDDPNVPHPDEFVGLYGIDLAADSEYSYQRPNAEWLIGYAQGRGIPVQIAEGSALLKASHLYGFEESPKDKGPLNEAFLLRTKAMLEKRRAAAVEQHEQTLALLNTLDGALEHCNLCLQTFKIDGRGATPRWTE